MPLSSRNNASCHCINEGSFSIAKNTNGRNKINKMCIIKINFPHRICRDKKDAKGEANAREISDVSAYWLFEYGVQNTESVWEGTGFHLVDFILND